MSDVEVLQKDNGNGVLKEKMEQMEYRERYLSISERTRYFRKVMQAYSRRIRISVLPSCSITLAVQILPRIKGVQKSDRTVNLLISRGLLKNSLPFYILS